MAITKRTVLNSIKRMPDDTLQIRFAKQEVEDGKVVASTWHRTSISPGDDGVAQMGRVITHLLALGHPISDNAMRGHIESEVRAVHTPAVVAAYLGKVAATRAAQGMPPRP